MLYVILWYLNLFMPWSLTSALRRLLLRHANNQLVSAGLFAIFLVTILLGDTALSIFLFISINIKHGLDVEGVIIANSMIFAMLFVMAFFSYQILPIFRAIITKTFRPEDFPAPAKN